jgi:molecular chaperone GrpE
MMSETDNYPDLEKETDIVNNEEFLSTPEATNEDDSTVLETDFESAQTVDESNEDIMKEDSPEGEAESTDSDNNVIDEVTQTQIKSLEEEIASLKTQLETQKAQTKDFKDQFLRLTADFENFRRRTSKEKEELEQINKKKTINELLPVVDNFERARTQIKPANDGEMTIHKSYQGVYKTFVDSLKKIGVSAMRPEGELFDPNYHEAMLREPTKEYPEGTVIEQLVRGYLLNDIVLRHAMVKVAAPLEEESETEFTDTDENISEAKQS